MVLDINSKIRRITGKERLILESQVSLSLLGRRITTLSGWNSF